MNWAKTKSGVDSMTRGEKLSSFSIAWAKSTKLIEAQSGDAARRYWEIILLAKTMSPLQVWKRPATVCIG